MPPNPSLKQLAAEVAQFANTIVNFLESPDNAFTENDFAGHLGEPLEIQGARIGLISHCRHLTGLLLAPNELAVFAPMMALNDVSALLGTLHCKLYEHVPLDGSATYGAIADAANIDESRTRAFLRHAMTLGMFREVKKGKVAHTEASKQLILNSDLRDWYGHLMFDVLPAIKALPKTMDTYGRSTEAIHSATNVAFNTTIPPMIYIAQGAVAGPRFSGAMRLLGAGPALNDSHMVNNFPWSELGSSTVVDVGGGNGHLSISIASKFPDLKFIIQDLDEQIKTVTVPENLKGRVDFQVHDFFLDQPVSAEIYVLRGILHDWPDDKAISIISHLIPAMKRGSRIILNETIFPDFGELPAHIERLKTAINLQMDALLNGKERTVEEWSALVTSASDKLKLGRVITPPGSHLSLIEVLYE